MANTPKIFAIYKGDRFIDVGTISEMASRLKVKENTLRFYATKVHRKRVSEANGLIVVRLEEDDE